MTNYALAQEIHTRSLLADVDQFMEGLTHAIFSNDIPGNTIERIGQIVAEAATSGSTEAIMGCRWRLSRLMRRLERSGRIDLELHGALRTSVSSLGAALFAPDLTRSVSKASKHRKKTLKSRILDALVEGPRRPYSLADELGVHQSEVSRALRSLHAKGDITRTNAPSWEADARGSWYALT